MVRAQALLAQAARGIGDFRQRANGMLTIVASGVPVTYLLPEVVAAFLDACPDVRVRIMSAASAQTMDALRAHAAEFGVVGGFAAAPEIEAVPLLEEEIVLVGPPAVAGRVMSKQEAEGATWISPYEGSAARAAIEAAWADAGITPRRRLEFAQLGGRAARRGAGGRRRGLQLVHCGARTARRYPWKGAPARMEAPPDDLAIVRHRDTILTPSAQRFVSMLHARWGRPVGRRRAAGSGGRARAPDAGQ